MNSFNFHLSVKVLIYSFILKDIFPVYRVLCWQFLPTSSSILKCHSMCSGQHCFWTKNLSSFGYLFLFMWCLFPSGCRQGFHFIVGSLSMMCLVFPVCFQGFVYFGSNSWISVLISFIIFITIITFSIFSTLLRISF